MPLARVMHGFLTMATTNVTKVRPSTCSDHRGAIDACVTVDGVEGEVTLLPSDYDGLLNSWGQGLHHWATSNLHDVLTDRETQREVIEAVREVVS